MSLLYFTRSMAAGSRQLASSALNMAKTLKAQRFVAEFDSKKCQHLDKKMPAPGLATIV